MTHPLDGPAARRQSPRPAVPPAPPGGRAPPKPALPQGAAVTTGSAFVALANQTFSGVVGSFTPAAGTTTSDYLADILWGDGNLTGGST